MSILQPAYDANKVYCPRSVTLVNYALDFATEAHAGQVRKYTGEPYIVHPVNVARIVMEVFPDVSAVAAAYLHDVVEDTEYTLNDLSQAGFGGDVVHLVDELTDVSKPEDGNRAERKRIDREHTAAACNGAKLVKLADLMDNTCSITRHDPNFAKVYLKEKLQLLPHLQHANKFLYEAAVLQVYMNLETVL